jgi:putative acetyltransferase
MSSPQIREYRPSDLDSVLALFRKTVHSVNARDYSPRQIEAWAPSHPDRDRWAGMLAKGRAFVAEDESTIVGFGSLEGNCIRLLYVHGNRQRRGIGSLILTELEREARSRGVLEVFAEVSVTALPFFRKRGYVCLRRRQKELGGMLFSVRLMKRRL